MAKTCPKCGARADDHHRFCADCGTTLEGVGSSSEEPHGYCTSCGGPLSQRDRFCARCGAPSSRPAVGGAGTGAESETERFDPEDFFREWDGDRIPVDEAPTEQVRLQPARATDTAVLPVLTADAPEPARPARDAGRDRNPFPWAASLAFAGAVAVVASSAVPLAAAARTVLPRDVPVSELLFPGGPPRGPSLGLLLLALGVLGALTALITMLAPRLGILRRLIGLVTLAVPVLVAIRIVNEGTAVPDLFGVLGASVYLTLAGALTQIVAGRRRRR